VKAKKSEHTAKKSRLEKVLGALFLFPFFTVLMGVAGALLVAMAFSLFTLNLNGVRTATRMVMQTVFASGILDAISLFVPVALPAGIAAAGITLLFFLFPDQKTKATPANKANRWWAAFGIGVVAVLLVMVGAYCVNVIRAVFQSALLISRWGCFIGAALGGLAGIAAGLSLAGDSAPGGRTTPHSGGRKGADPADLDWWQALEDTDTDFD
jgi:hypothetical protein